MESQHLTGFHQPDRMTERRIDRFTITGYAAVPTSGRAEIVVFDSKDRMVRALKGLLSSWLVAAATVFIPVGHFLLVPGFFLFGIYVFVARFRATEVTREVQGVCPDCGQEQQFESSGHWSLPRTLACAACGRSLAATAEL